MGIEETRGAFVFFNQAGRGFATGVPLGANDTVPYALDVGDLNADGRIDILVGNVSAASVVFFNDGTGLSFMPVRFGENTGTAYGFAIGDLDKDGYLDIALARTGAPNVVYFGAPVSPDRPPTPAPRSPRAGVINTFDDGSIRSAFGHGWEAASDVVRGGRSVATITLAPEGARGSSGRKATQGRTAWGWPRRASARER